MNTKNNQRFRDTEIRMEAAMLDIMKRTDFDKITVREICEKAEVNRSTFYAHFLDIYDMLDKMEVELSRDLLNRYLIQSGQNTQAFSAKSFIPFLEHIKEHSYFYKITLQSRKSFPIRRGYEPLWNDIIKPLCVRAGIISEDEIIYYFIYFQAGFTMALKHWVDTGCKKSEIELANTIKNCIPSILSSNN